MKRPLRQVLEVAVVVTAASAACSSGGHASDATQTTVEPATSTETPTGERTAAEEAVELEVVPLPDEVIGARFPVWAADGERIVFSGRPDGGSRDEIYSVREDGTELACLTCGVDPVHEEPLLKPIAFPDGRRVLVRIGEQSPVQAAQHGILECVPSVAECMTAQLLPVEVPAVADGQEQREMRIAPDGTTVGFTQVRRDTAGENTFVAVVAELRRADDHYETDDARVVSTLGELKNFTPDGQRVLVAAFTTLPDQVANPDIIAIDLATGAETRVTQHGDYDEDIDVSPDGDWYAVFSGRTTGLFETVSQVERPNFIGPGLEGLTGYLFTHHRKELLEPWLVPVGAEETGAIGQRLNPGSSDDGYDARVLVSWHPTGDRILFWEGRGDPFAPPTDNSRIVVVRLTDRTPADPVDSNGSPLPTWAPPLEGFVPEPVPPMTSRDGAYSGTVTITRTLAAGESGQAVLEVEYKGFSDDGEWIVTGSERSTYGGGLTGQSRYTAELTLSGPHVGYLRADATITTAEIDGTIESEVDGRKLTLP